MAYFAIGSVILSVSTFLGFLHVSDQWSRNAKRVRTAVVDRPHRRR
ncbi:MAG: hypothetical protein AAGD08_00215 [Pseudomonadota bacterium]